MIKNMQEKIIFKPFTPPAIYKPWGIFEKVRFIYNGKKYCCCKSQLSTLLINLDSQSV